MSRVGAAAKLHVIYPSSRGWDAARVAWNLAVDQQPEAVAFAESVDDVVAAVALARERGWQVAAQGTGHGAAPIGSLEGTLLLKTERLRGVAVEPGARVASVAAGCIWQEVVEAAAYHGLTALAGSSPDVGAVGYSLGGGHGWLGRKHGLAANSILAVELVTADGRTIRADREHEPELFWALRGGGGSFGVVTALELRLVPLAEVYAGVLWWPIERDFEILEAWRALTRRRLPDELTTVGRLLRPPPLPEIPEPVRGKQFVVVEVIHAGTPVEAEPLLAPLRALEPVLDTLRPMPVTELSHLHMDPAQPVPGVGDGALLADLSPDALRALLRVAGAASSSSLLSVELRHLGGELARARPGNGVLASLEGDYAVYAVGLAPTAEAAAAAGAESKAVLHALAPWTAPRAFLNLAETARSPASLWGEEAAERLLAVKRAVDPENVFRANHPVFPDGT